jgi:hypothetical protein
MMVIRSNNGNDNKHAYAGQTDRSILGPLTHSGLLMSGFVLGSPQNNPCLVPTGLLVINGNPLEAGYYPMLRSVSTSRTLRCVKPFDLTGISMFIIIIPPWKPVLNREVKMQGNPPSEPNPEWSLGF